MSRLLAGLLLSVLLLTPACRSDGEGRLPKEGSLYSSNESGDIFRVTWAGTANYNQGGCDIGLKCVHLVVNVDEAMATELAVTLEEFNAGYKRVSR